MAITRATNLADIGSGIGTNPVQTIGFGPGIQMDGSSTGVITATTFSGTATNAGTAVNLGVGATGYGLVLSADLTAANVTIGGTLTYDDVTNIDSVGLITARSGINVTGGDVGIGLTNPEDYGNFADDLVIYDSSQPGMTFASGTSGYGSIYFADGTIGNAASRGQIQYVHSDDYMAFATAATEALRITSGGEVIVNGTATGSSAKFEVRSTTGSVSSATARLNGDATDTGAINTGSSLLFAGHDGGNSRDFASIFAGKENGTSGNYDAYLSFGTRSNGNALAERLRIDSSGNSTFTGTVSDSIGPLRRLGQEIKSGDYTLVAGDAGKHIRVDGAHTITVPDNVFTSGDMITIVANSSSDVPITQGSGLSLYNASDGTTGSKTQAARTVSTILFAEGGSGAKAYISGGGLS